MSKAAVAIGWILAASVLWAQEFRVENFVREVPSGKLLQHTLTLCDGQKVYDLVEPSGEVAVFDWSGGKVVLLHRVSSPSRWAPGVKAEIPLVELDRMIVQLQQHVAQKDKPRWRSLIHGPTKFVLQGQSWWVRTPWLEYRVEPLAAPLAQQAQLYYQFLQWSTRLAALENPWLLLRMQVNRHLIRRQELPGKVLLLVYRPGALGLKRPELAMRSQHHFQWNLSDQDHNRIRQVQKQLEQFHLVDWKTFRHLERPAR